MVDWGTLLQIFATQIVDYMPKLAGALFILVVGWIAINFAVRMIKSTMKRRRVDKSLRPFLGSLLRWTLRALLLVSVAGMLGVHMTSFIAVLGAAGLAIGLALQGSLANFAGGVLILMFKPFQVDEYIEAQGVAGTVHEIRIFHTTLLTADNIYITIPNGELSNHVVKNFSRMPTRRHDLSFGIAYDSDVNKAKKALLDIAKKDKRVLRDPEPVIYVKEYGDNSVILLTRFWSTKEDFWNLHFDYNEEVKKYLDKAGIEMPFPQMDVHLKKE